MAQWVKYEQRKITEYREGCVYKTKVIGHHWFKSGSPEQPQDYHINEDNIQWCPTVDFKFQSENPNKSEN